MAEEKNFFEKAINELQKLSVLEINTVVGEFSFVDNSSNLKVDLNSKTNDKIVSRINLLSGDITTAMSDKFVSDYKELREYHLIRENQGHEIIKRNITVLKEISTTIIQLVRDKDKDQTLQIPAPE